jgi:hypothetical protein
MGDSERPALSLAEVFYGESEINSTDLHAKLQRHQQIVLTPRSYRAVEVNGVCVDHLQNRPMSSFLGPDVDESGAELRVKAYTDRRERLFALCRQTRAKLVSKEARLKDGRDLPVVAKKEKVSMVGQAAKQLEKLKGRQEKDIKSMLDFEVKRREMQETANAAALREADKELLRSKEAGQRTRDAAEARRQRELAKQAAEDAETERSQEYAYKQFLKEMEQQKQVKVQQQQAQHEAILRERHQREQLELFRQHTEEIMKEQQQAIMDRMSRMELDEEVRQQHQEEIREVRAEQLTIKRAKVAKRIDQNLTSARDIQDQMRADFEQRQEALAQKQADMQQVMDEENRLKRKMAALMERKRQMALQDAKLTEERKVSEIIQKRLRNEEVLEKVLEDRKRAHSLKMEAHKLSSNIRWDDVERRTRITALEQRESIVKMKKDAAKVERMCQDQANIREQQKDVSIKMSLQRQEINDIMHQCKVDKNWKKAETKVTLVMAKNAPPAGGKVDAKKKKKGWVKPAIKNGGGGNSPTPESRSPLSSAAGQMLAQPQGGRMIPMSNTMHSSFSLNTATSDKIAAALSQSNPFTSPNLLLNPPPTKIAAVKQGRKAAGTRPKTMESSRHAVYRQPLTSSGRF